MSYLYKKSVPFNHFAHPFHFPARSSSGPLETAFAAAAGFTTMAGIHRAAAAREQASRPNAEEWEVVYSVWMDMLQKDLEDTWLDSKHNKHA